MLEPRWLKGVDRSVEIPMGSTILKSISFIVARGEVLYVEGQTMSIMKYSHLWV